MDTGGYTMNQSILDFILRIIKPFTVWYGSLHLPYTRKRIDGKFYYRVRDDIKVGTVLLTKTFGEISNLLNPSELKHAAIYLGRDEQGIAWVSEAVGAGVVKTDLVTFLLKKDIVVGVWPKFLREEDTKKIYSAAHNYIGKPYDYLFRKGGEALYCFENVVLTLKTVRHEVVFKCKEIAFNKFIYDSDTFLDANLFNVVFDSREVNNV